jgi:hypothetical protein
MSASLEIALQQIGLQLEPNETIAVEVLVIESAAPAQP